MAGYPVCPANSTVTAMSGLISIITPLLPEAQKHHVRLPVICSGDEATLLSQTQLLLQSLNVQTIYWIGNHKPDNAVAISSIRHQSVLGSECDILVVNAFNQFPAELIAASAGCVKAGGLWLMLMPEPQQFARQPNLAHQALLPYPLKASTHQGCFQSFWLPQAMSANILYIENGTISRPLHWPATNSTSVSYAEQELAISAIMQVATGHRKRPLILTADRGRGKSAALGIAAARLALAGKTTLLLTAPTPDAASIALAHFRKQVPEPLQSCLRYLPPDELLQQQPEAALLLIDEAAAIPTPQLKKITQHYNRLVFATTEHGYEGSGHGFRLRFKPYLELHMPQFRQLHLQQPIRYAAHDPLEQLIFKSFLLRQELTTASNYIEQPLSTHLYQPEQLLQQPQKLAAIYSLLSLAHYQTQTRDLAALLDNPTLSVFTLEHDGFVVACALLSQEGELPSSFSQDIFRGKKRVQGHLLAQSLAFHCAQPEMITLKLARIMRITVHPEYQHRSIGSRLLQEISAHCMMSGYDILGTSFGLTPELLKFWKKNSYSMVRLGTQPDKASAEYSALMLQPLKAELNEISLKLAQDFAAAFYLQLPFNYSALSANLILELVTPPVAKPLTARENLQLGLFADNQRPIELIYPTLYNWFNQYYTKIPPQRAALLCALLWQKKAWHEMAFMFNLNGKSAIIRELQQTVRMIDRPFL